MPPTGACVRCGAPIATGERRCRPCRDFLAQQDRNLTDGQLAHDHRPYTIEHLLTSTRALRAVVAAATPGPGGWCIPTDVFLAALAAADRYRQDDKETPTP